MSEIYDLVVAGGGPAGSSAAITAAQLGFRVLLLEAGAFPRHKVCGEFVSGEAQPLLKTLLGNSEMFTGAPRISRARIFLESRTAEFPVSPAAISLARFDLDFALWRRAVALGISAKEKTVVKEVRRNSQSFTILTSDGNVRAHAVIDASGRWSTLRKLRQGKENWIGLKGHFFEVDAPASCDLYFFPGGYCGVQPLGNGIVNAAAMVRPEMARALPEVFSQNGSLQARARHWKASFDPLSTAPLFFRSPQTTHRGAALAGDAAAFLDPFAGDGISMALHSGKLAAECLALHLRGQCSLDQALEAYDSAYRKLIAPALKSAARLRRLLRMPTVLQRTAVSLLNVPFIARAAVEQTRIRRAG